LLPPPRQQVIDYRLLGSNFINPHAFLARLDDEQEKQVVLYQWPGQFPNVADLKHLRDKQHPGESTPDPIKSASLPFVGGLMCLVGGVWMFKRRGSAV